MQERLFNCILSLYFSLGLVPTFGLVFGFIRAYTVHIFTSIVSCVFTEQLTKNGTKHWTFWIPSIFSWNVYGLALGKHKKTHLPACFLVVLGEKKRENWLESHTDSTLSSGSYWGPWSFEMKMLLSTLSSKQISFYCKYTKPQIH